MSQIHSFGNSKWRLIKPTSSPYVKVVKSKIHGIGVIAQKKIPKGAKIIEYVGELITKDEAEERGPALIDKAEKDSSLGAVYLFDLDSNFDIDGNVQYNTARFINHSCDPNCETDEEDSQIWIRALRSIKKGEELTYNYGYEVEDYADHPCLCGSEKCVGYIVAEDKWSKLKRLIAKTAKKRKKKKK